MDGRGKDFKPILKILAMFVIIKTFIKFVLSNTLKHYTYLSVINKVRRTNFMMSVKYRKSVQALNYFAQREGGTINYMKAVKLIWLSDRYHLRKYGRKITNDSYVAMKNGPVPSTTKDIISKSIFLDREVIDYANQYLSEPEKYSFKSIQDIDETVFSKSDMLIMDEIFNYYGARNEFELSDYSHLFPEWKRFKSQLEMGGRAFNIVESDFFSSDMNDGPFAQNEELVAMSMDEYNGNA